MPNNWVETEVGELSTLIRGVSYKKNDAKSVKEEGDVLILRGGNIQDGKLDIENNDLVYVDSSLVKDSQRINKGDVVIVGSTGSKNLIGKAAIVNEDNDKIAFGAFLMLIRPTEALNAKLFDYYFISDNYRNVIRELAGGVNINNIRKEYITGLKFPLPPLPEQKRIVAKLDGLFAHLEELKRRLANVPELLKQFRQSVLTQAVTGKLTEAWREGKELEDWSFVVLNDLGTWNGGGTPSKSVKEYWTNGEVLWITPKDMKATFLDDSMDKITKDAVSNSSAKMIDSYSILVVTRSGILRRIFPVCMNTKPTTVNQDLKALSTSKDFMPKYVLYSLMGLEESIRNSCMKSGTTVESIDFGELKKFKIGNPVFKEQVEIVRRVESLFAKADAIQAQYESLVQKIEDLTPTILAKAFRGELVEQLDTDGDARELLEEIKKLKKC